MNGLMAVIMTRTLRRTAPRSELTNNRAAQAIARPRPTFAAALLMTAALSVPVLLMSVIQALL